jgi:hypothetical protein
MTRMRTLPATGLGLLSLFNLAILAGASATPRAQSPAPADWPRLDPPRAIASGYKTATSAELQWRDGSWVPITRQRFEYDTAGELTTLTFESDFNGTWRPSRRHAFTREAGRVTEMRIEESVGPALQDRGRHQFAYTNGRLSEARIDAWSFEQRWTPLRRETFEYDPAGRLQFEYTHAGAAATAASTNRIESLYDANNRLIEEAKQSRQRGTWATIERVTRTYGPSERLEVVSMLAVVRGGTAQWTEAFRIRHTYDSAGRRVEAVTDVLGSAGLRPSARQVYAYDPSGNQIETRYQGWRNGAWTEARRETWTYVR